MSTSAAAAQWRPSGGAGAARRVGSFVVPWRELSTPERWICGYFSALPLLWLVGLNLPVALIVTFGTLALYVRSRRAYLVSLPWLLVALAQTAAIVVNMWAAHQPPIMLAKHALSSYMLGWYVLWASICIGASGIIDAVAFVRAVARIAFAYLLLAIPAYAIALTFKAPFLILLSPVGHLLPADSPARIFSFSLFVYVWEDFFGVLMPRLSLFFPWSTAAGYAGIFLTLLLLSERSSRRRRAAIGCALFMILASMSRLAWVAFVACVAFRGFLALPRSARFVIGCLALACGAGMMIGGVPFDRIEDTARAKFDAARPGASQAREAVYVATWRGIRESPWLGHGWPGESTMAADPNSISGADNATMVVGSHSTVSGLIYKGGAVTFALFVIALLSTVAVIAAAPRYEHVAKDALAMIVGVGFMCAGEGLESLVVPNLFAFLWIGMAIHLGWSRRWSAS